MKRFNLILALFIIICILFTGCTSLEELVDDTTTSEVSTKSISEKTTQEKTTIDTSTMTTKEKIEHYTNKYFYDDTVSVVYNEGEKPSAIISIEVKELVSIKTDTKSVIYNIYQLLHDLSSENNVSYRITIFYPTTDNYGNSGKNKVILADYSSDTLSKVNWEAFDYTNIDNIADSFEADSSIKQYIP